MNKALLLAFSIIFVSCNAIKLDYDYITSSNQEIKSSLSKIDKKKTGIILILKRTQFLELVLKEPITNFLMT
jgi:hypothetical protein